MTEQTSQTTESTETETGAETAEGTALGGADQQQDEGEKKPEDQQQAKKKDGEDGEQKPAGPPETYDLKAPEGQDFDAETFGAVEPTLRELGLTNDQAQKLVDAYAGQVMPKLTERANKAILDRAATQRKEWADAFEADAEIGGARKGDTLSAAARVFDHYGLKKGEGLRLLLDESGLGNHPDLIRVFARIGQDMAEGSFDRGDAVTKPKTAEASMYGPEFQPK